MVMWCSPPSRAVSLPQGAFVYDNQGGGPDDADPNTVIRSSNIVILN